MICHAAGGGGASLVCHSERFLLVVLSALFFLRHSEFSPRVILNFSEESFYLIVMPNVRRANLRAHAPHIFPVFGFCVILSFGEESV